MVVTDVLCAMNLAVSAMVNGVCCCYQMTEENKRRKEHETFISNILRNEFELHRQMDPVLERDKLAVSSRRQDERRRKLMTLKAYSIMAKTNTNYSRDQPTGCGQVKPIVMDMNPSSMTMNHPFSGAMDSTSKNIFRSKDESSQSNIDDISGHHFAYGNKSKRNSSLISLLDDDDDDDDDNNNYDTDDSYNCAGLICEDDDSFEEICIE